MSLAVSRMLLRTPQVGRMTLRHASTTSEAANAASKSAAKAKEGVEAATSSASQGLSKVTSSAGSSLSKAGQAAGSALSSIGGRTGRLIGFVQCTSAHSLHTSLADDSSCFQAMASGDIAQQAARFWERIAQGGTSWPRELNHCMKEDRALQPPAMFSGTVTLSR